MEPKIHVHLHAKDLDASRAFYRAFLGVEPVKDKPGYLKFLPRFAPLNLAISAHASADRGGSVSHLGMQLDSVADVMRELARVKAAGLAVVEEMGVDCCHANQDKFWTADPDGHQWEVYHLNHDLDGDAKSTQAVPAPAAAGCCPTGPGVGGGCGTGARASDAR
ncbi:MAG TPA: ArsI/CadI family heavy metal resistance metalloenzyme [Planctomycetota bacterium]|nr:ArsI/CadI family heavy metal resistance metalloenzyme [Planctomycetota bacterium]